MLRIITILRNSLLFIVFLPFCAVSQTIKGRLLTDSSKAVEGANVTLLKDTVILQKLSSDAKGNYCISNIPRQKVFILFSKIGFSPVKKEINFSSDTTIDIMMKPKIILLKNVEVTERKKLIQRKVDRLVFNVENNIIGAGSDVVDLLAITPLLRVDDNAISISGKGAVTVMVDEKIVPLTGDALTMYLKSIQADNIASIEVITNPPAQYEARGNAGMINIVTKKKRTLGFVGSTNASLSRSSNFVGAYGLNLNYNLNNKVIFTANLNAAKGANFPTYSKTIDYPTQHWSSHQNSKEYTTFFRGTVGVEYQASKQNSIGLSFTLMDSHPSKDQPQRVEVLNKVSQKLDSLLTSQIFNDRAFITRIGNAHFNHKFKKPGKELTFDFDYFGKRDSTRLSLNNASYDANGHIMESSRKDYLSNAFLNSDGYSANIVLKIPIKKNSLLFGGKATIVANQNDVSLSIKQTESYEDIHDFTNAFSYREAVQALFSSYSFEFLKFNAQVGLRGEFTQARGISETDNSKNTSSYFNLFPTVYLTYPKKDNTFSFSYGRRINRPPYSALNPATVYQGINSYAQGNPFLRPSFTNNFEFTHTYKNILVSMLTYTVTSNSISAINLVTDTTRKQVLVLGNFLTTKVFSLDEVVDLTPFKWWETVNDFALYYSSTNSSASFLARHTTGFGGSFRSGNNIYFDKSKSFTGSLIFNYQLPTRSGIYKNAPFHFFDVTVSKNLFKKQLQLSFQARDIFKTKNVGYSYEVNGIENKFVTNNDSRRFVLGARYTFGNTKLKTGKAYSISGEEQGRQ